MCRRGTSPASVRRMHRSGLRRVDYPHARAHLRAEPLCRPRGRWRASAIWTRDPPEPPNFRVVVAATGLTLSGDPAGQVATLFHELNREARRLQAMPTNSQHYKSSACRAPDRWAAMASGSAMPGRSHRLPHRHPGEVAHRVISKTWLRAAVVKLEKRHGRLRADRSGLEARGQRGDSANA
jgi:hypothetical protein